MITPIISAQLLLTPFRIQNVPPPMSSHKLALSPALGPPVHIAFGHVGDVVGVLVVIVCCVGVGVGVLLFCHSNLALLIRRWRYFLNVF